MVVGLGVDMIEIARVRKSIARFRDRFLGRVFTAGERSYCDSRNRGAAQSYALRWAAKEAVAKALGTGIRAGVDFKDIEVVSDSLGRPSVKLSGGAERQARSRGVTLIHLSLSHDGPTAVALAVAEGAASKGPSSKRAAPKRRRSAPGRAAKRRTEATRRTAATRPVPGRASRTRSRS